MKTQSLILWMALLPGLLAAGPTLAAPAAGGTVTIVNTGVGLTPGYRAIVAPNGALSATLKPRRGRTIHRDNMLIALTRKRFFADLQKAEPIDRLPTGTIALSGSRQVKGGQGNRRFREQQTVPAGSARRLNVTGRPQVYIVYGGKQSPNLRTVNSDAGRALYQDVKQILQVLRMPIPNVP